MAKGAPNEQDPKKLLNFVAKVWDEKAQTYKPIYIAPDATDTRQGDVWLSDAVDGTDNAATGVTAATPAAVKTVYDETKKKVDTTVETAQSIKSSLNPDKNNAQDLGTNEKKWRNVYATTFTGDLRGNADSADILKTPRTISIKNGNAATASISFDGGSDKTFSLNQLDAATVTTGILPLSVVPKAALERLKIVTDQAARFALTTDPDTGVQEGDTVYQQDTGIMYLVVDTTKLDQAAGYQEYKAATAARAMQADKLDPGAKIQTDLSSEANPNFTGTADINPGVKGILPLGHGGTGVDLASSPNALINLESEDEDNLFAVSPRPGVTGVLPIVHGGTNLTSNPSMITNLGTESADTVFKENPRPGIMGVLALGHGGTGVNLPSAPNLLVDLTKTDADNVFQATPRPGISGILPIANGGTGNANGLAASATQLQNSRNFSIKGDVVAAAVGFNGTGNVELSATLQDNTVTSAKIVNGTIVADDLASNSVTTAKIVDANVTTGKIADSAVTTNKIANNAVNLTKLGADVGTVYVGTTQPTDNNVIWWIDTTDDE